MQRHWKTIAGVLLLLIAFGAAVMPVRAQDNPPRIYFFWGDGCPHCADAKPVMRELIEKYPGTELYLYEVWYVDENQQFFNDMAASIGQKPQGVPTIFLGDKVWVGWNEQIEQELEQEISRCLAGGCKDAAAGVIPTNKLGIPEISDKAPRPVPTPTFDPATDKEHVLTVPLIGKVDLDAQSLWISTALIAFVDGFNPCSLWVLSMLMALVIHTGSRKKIFLIGMIFLTVTAGVYALFIAGLFSVLTMVSFLGWIQALVAAVSLFFGLVNIKDYFWYKEGVSFTISEKDKPGIFQRMRKVMNSTENIWALAGATIALAAGVSLVEFSCTAGFPVLWTNILTAQNVAPATFGLLLLLYLVIYQIDELAIFMTVVFTLKASRLEEKQGRILKLVGGTLMLTLAVVMLINPSLMNDLGDSLLIFGAAFVVAALILLVHRTILPRFGIWIGSEAQSGKKHGRSKMSRGGVKKANQRH